MKPSHSYSASNKVDKPGLEISQSHPYDGIPWSTLSDIQKAQVLLGSIRLLDQENFIYDFNSFEQPQTKKR